MKKQNARSENETPRKTPMTPEAAARIQSHADRSGSNPKFKAAAQRAAAKRGGPKK